MKLLLVEDQQECIEDFLSTLKRYSIQHEFKADIKIASSVAEAIDKLDTSFDGAIIDLKLNNDKDGGNKVIAEIQDKYRIPIAVLTGTPSNFGHDSSPLLELFLRDDGYDPVLDFLKAIYLTGLTQILGGRGIFEETLNTLFWKNIPGTIAHYISGDENPELTQVQLLRHTISHMNELLEHNLGVASNSAETYIYPPIRSNVTEGGIVKEKQTDGLYVIVTPACDISNGKADFLQIVRITEIHLRPEVKKLINPDQPPSSRLKSQIGNFVRNKLARFHYLPKFGPISHESIVDFQDVQSVPCQSFNENYEFQGNISGVFYKDLVNRFSSNYSRQGSPDYNFAKEESNLLSNFT